MNIQGLDIEIVGEYKYLGVHLNNKLDWTTNTDVLYRKGQSRLHLLRRLRSFGVCRTLLRTFYDTVVEVRSGLKNPARPDPGPRVLKPDPARARSINLIFRPEPETNPKFYIASFLNVKIIYIFL